MKEKSNKRRCTIAYRPQFFPHIFHDSFLHKITLLFNKSTKNAIFVCVQTNQVQKNHNIQEIDDEFNKSFDYGVRCTEKTISEMFNKHKNDMIQIQK